MQKEIKVFFGLKAISHKLKAGFSLVEVIIGSSLILISLVGLVTAYSFYIKAGLKNTDNLKAVFLLQEGVEAVMLLRDDAWSTLSALATGTPHYLFWNGTKWTATSTVSLIDATFARTFKLDDVYRRDADQDIVATTSPDAKSLDSGTKKLTVRVVASSTASIDKSIVTYLANLFE